MAVINTTLVAGNTTVLQKPLVSFAQLFLCNWRNGSGFKELLIGIVLAPSGSFFFYLNPIQHAALLLRLAPVAAHSIRAV